MDMAEIGELTGRSESVDERITSNQEVRVETFLLAISTAGDTCGDCVVRHIFIDPANTLPGFDRHRVWGKRKVLDAHDRRPLVSLW